MHSLKPTVRRRIASFLLLSLLAMTSWGLRPALADGISTPISNGQTVTGTVTGSGFDKYTFKAPVGGAFVVTVSKTGARDATFVPEIDLVAPGGAQAGGIAQPLYARLERNNAAAGTWTVRVSRGNQGATGGTYALTLVQVPGAHAAVAMSPGKAYSGAASRGHVDVFTFKGVTGHAKTLKLTATGDDGFAPEISVFTATGGLAGGFGCVKTCSQNVPITTDGIYTVIAGRSDHNDVAGTYTLSVNDKN